MLQCRRYCVLISVTAVSLLGLFMGYLHLPLGNLSTLLLQNQSTESNGSYGQIRRLSGSVNNVATDPIDLPDGCDLLKKMKNMSSSSSSGLIKPDCISSAFLVYQCDSQICGGLGDRLKGVISTFLLALLTNRTFVIRHSKPCSLTESLVPNLYDWTHCQKYATATATMGSNTVRYFDGSMNGNLKSNSAKIIQELLKRRVTYVQINDNIVPEVLNGNHPTLHIPPEFYNSSCQIESVVLKTLFKPSAKLSADIQSFTNKIKGNALVCGHIRMGQNPTIPLDVKRGLNASEILRFLDTYNHSNKHAIFVATDSESVRHQVQRRYTNAISTGRQIVHVDRFEHTGTECAGLYSAVMEMQLLSRCDVLVLCNSGFGVMAARFRASSDKLFCYHSNNNPVVPCSYEKLNSFYDGSH